MCCDLNNAFNVKHAHNFLNMKVQNIFYEKKKEINIPDSVRMIMKKFVINQVMLG